MPVFSTDLSTRSCDGRVKRRIGPIADRGQRRFPDQPQATNLTSRSCCPGCSSAVTVTRPRSGKLSARVLAPAGPSTTWSITAAISREILVGHELGLRHQ